MSDEESEQHRLESMIFVVKILRSGERGKDTNFRLVRLTFGWAGAGGRCRAPAGMHRRLMRMEERRSSRTEFGGIVSCFSLDSGAAAKEGAGAKTVTEQTKYTFPPDQQQI